MKVSRIAAAALGLSLAAISPTAHAATFFSGWFTTNISAGPGESAQVTEGILYDNLIGSAGAPAYDYIFMVANTGAAPIAAFGGGTGPSNPAGILYNSDISFGLPGLPASGPVSLGAVPAFLTQQPPAQPGKRLLGGWGGANNPYQPIAAVTPYTPLYPGAKGLTSPNYQYWGFEVSSTGVGYALGWYNLVGNQIFGTGRVTRFDLNSTLGPVAGGAFIDPFSGSNYIIDWTNGDSLSLATPIIPNPLTTFCDPTTDPTCSPDIIPPDIANLNFTGFGDTPLPGALPLFATGLGALGLLGWRRKRKVALAA
jgi:hypothetical protein